MKPLSRLMPLIVCFFMTLASAAPDPLAPMRESVAEGNLAEALVRLESYLATHPDDLDAQLLKGVVLTRQGKARDAIDTFRMIADKNPDIPESHNNLAVLYAAEGEYEAARQALSKAIQLQPLYETAHENLGDVYVRLATMAYDEAFRLNKDNARAREKWEQLTEFLQDQAGLSGAPEPEAQSLAEKTDGDVACYTAGAFASTAETNPVIAWAEERNVSTTRRVEKGRKIRNYKVFLPPLSSMRAARRQVERMQEAGIRDVIVISRGQLTNGVAVGVFTTVEAAEQRVEDLRAKGYDAQYAPRYRTSQAFHVDLISGGRDPFDEEGFKEAFPDRMLKRVPCS